MVAEVQEAEPAAGLSASRVARGTIWAALDNWTQQGSQLAAFIIIGNIVGPDVFGIMAMAMLYVLFVHALLVDSFAEAVVQRVELEREHLEVTFWFLASVGLVAMILSFGLAGWVALGFSEPVLTEVIRWLSISFVLVGPSSLLQSRLRRDFNFRVLAGRSVAVYGGAAATGITLALLGFGLWSLVIFQLCLRGLDFLVLLGISRWLPRPKFSWRHFRELLDFGVSNVGNRVLGLFTEHADRILVGYFLGPLALGLYAIANRVVDGAGNALAGVMHTVAFSAFSKLQEDKEQLQDAIASATHIASLIVFPVFAGLALVAPALVDLVLSDEWRPAGTIIRILSISCLAGFTFPASYLLVSALMAIGRADQVLVLGVFTVVVRTGLCLWAVQYGVLAVVLAVSAFEFLALPIRFYLVKKHIRLDIPAYLRIMAPAALATLLMAMSVGATYALVVGQLTPLAVVLLLIAVGVASYSAALFAFARPSLRLVLGALRR